jgi:hypothetical protein
MTTPSGADSLATLAAELSALRGQLRELTERVDGQQESLATAAGLSKQVEALSRLITRPPGTGAQEEQARAHPRIWAIMGDDESTDALRDLARWVTGILLVSYPHAAAVLPPCWPAHEAAVSELDWLYWTWTEWATDPQARARDAADWHDRWLPGTLARIRPILADCTASDQHKKPAHQRPEHTGYQRPPETSPRDWHPELLFIEQMDRADREHLRELGAYPR